MKKRVGFVSNSSSASFVLSKPVLTWPEKPGGAEVVRPTEEQIHSVMFELPKLNGGDFVIGETKEFIIGYSSMDNVGVEDYFKKIGIPFHLYQIDTNIGWVQGEFIKETISKWKN
jgi:hypothetical protein